MHQPFLSAFFQLAFRLHDEGAHKLLLTGRCTLCMHGSCMHFHVPALANSQPAPCRAYLAPLHLPTGLAHELSTEAFAACVQGLAQLHCIPDWTPDGSCRGAL